MTDEEFVSELRRAIIMIIKAIFKKYGIDLVKTFKG
jgi:hypothetical protein